MQKLTSVRLPVQIIKQGRQFVAYTPVLDLSTSGRTLIEVKKRFEEIVNIFFEEIIEAGTLDKVLGDLGWRKLNRSWTPPEIVLQQSMDFKVPAAV
jgi:hypothetical protein